MANFNLDDYETVDSRIKRFYDDNPTGRITTELVDFTGAPGGTRWIVKASIWRGSMFDAPTEPDGTGLAFENDGEGMANKTSALENCETSAIGRALANIGYSGDKRASREEMTKVKAGPVDTRAADALANEWIEQINAAETVSQLQAAWEGAGKATVANDPRVIAAKDARKKKLGVAA